MLRVQPASPMMSTASTAHNGGLRIDKALRCVAIGQFYCALWEPLWRSRGCLGAPDLRELRKASVTRAA